MKTEIEIEQLAHAHVKNNMGELYNKKGFDTFKNVEFFIDGYNKAMQEYSQYKQGWISVKDKPDEAGWYLVSLFREFDKIEKVEKGFWWETDFFEDIDSDKSLNNEYWKVTHWQPLPLPASQFNLVDQKKPDISNGFLNWINEVIRLSKENILYTAEDDIQIRLLEQVKENYLEIVVTNYGLKPDIELVKKYIKETMNIFTDVEKLEEVEKFARWLIEYENENA